MDTLKFSIETQDRLDRVASQALGLSRTQVQKAIKNGQILVNDEISTVKRLVNNDSVITYDKILVQPKIRTKHAAVKLEILYEDDDVIVINKPAGLLVHSTETSDEPTLVEALVAYDPAIAEVGADKDRAGLVHRLDKATSGIIIAAKTQDAYDHLKKQFKDRKTTKRYTALVRGKIEKDHDIIDFTIGRSKSNGRMASRPRSQGGKEAITHYDVVTRFPHHSLLDIRIETGRTHQIRTHMYAIEHPVVGDTLYRQKGIKPMDIGRLFLHARELTITLPSGEEKTFKSPLPKELETILETIPKI